MPDDPHSPERLSIDAAPRAAVDAAVAELTAARDRLRELSLEARRRLLRRTLDAVAREARPWFRADCQAKGVDPDSPAGVEQLAVGPLATLRYVQVTRKVYRDLAWRGRPRLPGPLRHGPGGRFRLGIMPLKFLFDHVLFRGFRAEVWLRPGLARAELPYLLPDPYQVLSRPPRVALVLGAGNVSSIPVVDALGKFFEEGKLVLLKLSPVNDYLAPIFARALAPLVEGNWLRIIRGDGGVGDYAARHPGIDEVHVTGSLATHDAVVWGPAGEEREARRQTNSPRLDKPITSELGNVTPWVILPGEYTERELDFQAENVAAMIVHNASFNCIALRMIVCWRGWPQRDAFLEKLARHLARIPPRPAYYPGAVERFRRFTGRDIQPTRDGALPWTLVRDTSPATHPLLFAEEAFVCVAGETALDAADAEAFLDAAVEFVNDRVFGTLGVGLMVPRGYRDRGPRESRFWEAVARLRYGTVAINHWPALSFALMAAPWGGFPGATLAAPGSGLGWTHNPFQLREVEKTVLDGPLVVRPKPFWFPSHRHAPSLGEQMLRFYHRPRWWRMFRLVGPAFRG